jgi:guanylate kinase
VSTREAVRRSGTRTEPDAAARVPGIPFVVSGPSGAGKSTILRRVLAADGQLRFSVSHTTRPPRAGETDGVDYHFVDREHFRVLAEGGAFLEWAEYQGNLYGTSHDAVREHTARGLDVLLEVEVEGAKQLHGCLDAAVFAFIIPPSADELERRLRGRGSDGDEVIRRRLARATEELRAIGGYDFVIVNEDLERAVADLGCVIRACRLRRERMVSLYRDRFDFG